jgi:hypothetical protein
MHQGYGFPIIALAQDVNKISDGREGHSGNSRDIELKSALPLIL